MTDETKSASPTPGAVRGWTFDSDYNALALFPTHAAAEQHAHDERVFAVLILPLSDSGEPSEALLEQMARGMETADDNACDFDEYVVLARVAFRALSGAPEGNNG